MSGCQDDHSLVQACRAGQSEAFGLLVRRYQDRLFHTVYRLVENPEDAQDVVQETFLNAYQSLDGFKGDALLFTWLYRIAVNTAISLKRKRKATVSIEAGRNGEHAIEPPDPSDASRPGHNIERVERERRVRAIPGRWFTVDFGKGDYRTRTLRATTSAR